MEEKIYNMVIIGAGPAGMSAAVYAKRAELSVLVIERDFASGGQIVKTYEVDNYLGLPGIGGLLSPERRFFPAYSKGLYALDDDCQMYVSGGIGKLRLLNPPEINFLTLSRCE